MIIEFIESRQQNMIYWLHLFVCLSVYDNKIIFVILFLLTTFQGIIHCVQHIQTAQSSVHLQFNADTTVYQIQISSIAGVGQEELEMTKIG